MNKTVEIIKVLIQSGGDLERPIRIAPGPCRDPQFPLLASADEHTHEWWKVTALLGSILRKSEHQMLVPIMDECRQNARIIRGRRLGQSANYESEFLPFEDCWALGRDLEEWWNQRVARHLRERADNEGLLVAVKELYLKKLELEAMAMH